MSRYWVFHDRRLKGPLDAEGLRALEGFSLDTRVCPEGGPETDWRPAHEHDELEALLRPQAARPAATEQAPLPSIPRLTPIAPGATPAPALPVRDDRVDALLARVETLENDLSGLRDAVDQLRQSRDAGDRRVDELASAVSSIFDKLAAATQEALPPPPDLGPAPVIEDAPAAEPTKSFDDPIPFKAPEPISELPPAMEFKLPDAPVVAPEDRTMVIPPPFSEIAHATSEAELPPAPAPSALPELPSFSPAPVETPPEDKTQVLHLPVAGRKLRVLCADDDELMRQAIVSTFEREGHDVEAVDDGKKALELVSMNAYDLVVLDEGMPGGSGFQVARAIAQVPLDSRPKVLIFTAQYVGNKLARETFLMSGANDVLSKEAGMVGLLKKACELTGLPLPP